MNRELAHYLREHPQLTSQHPTSSPSFSSPPWRIQDRFGEQDISAIIADFKASTPKHALVERYKIGMGSRKTLLRERGVKERRRYDIQQ